MLKRVVSLITLIAFLVTFLSPGYSADHLAPPCQVPQLLSRALEMSRPDSSLAHLLRQGKWSEMDIQSLYDKMAFFVEDLHDLYEAIEEGKVKGADAFVDAERMFVSPRDNKRWIEECVKWLSPVFVGIGHARSESQKTSIGQALFMGAWSNFLANIDPQQKIKDDQTLYDAALDLFITHFRPYFKKFLGIKISKARIKQHLQEWIQNVDFPDVPALTQYTDGVESYQGMYACVRSSFFTGVPSLIVKSGDEGVIVDRMVEDQTKAMGGEFVYIPMGPFSDRYQILGRRVPTGIMPYEPARKLLQEAMASSSPDQLQAKITDALQELLGIPWEYPETDAHYQHFIQLWEQLMTGQLDPSDQKWVQDMVRWVAGFISDTVSGSGQGLTFMQGSLVRAYEYAQLYPGKPVVIYCDNIDGSAASVRNGIFNNLLEKKQMSIAGYSNPFNGSNRIQLLPNMRLMFTSTRDVRISDRALYNRLQKYSLPVVSIKERVHMELTSSKWCWCKDDPTALARLQQELETVFATYEKDYARANNLTFDTYTITQLFERLEGIAEKENKLPWDRAILAKELHIIMLAQIEDKATRGKFENYLQTQGFASPLADRPYWFDDQGELYLMGVAVRLADPLKERIRQVKITDPEAKLWEQERILYQYRHQGKGEKSGLVLQSQSIHMLSSFIRCIKYNNKVMQAIGPTGIGKTYNGEGFAIIRGQQSFSEPIHKRSEQEQWTGFYDITDTGEFIFNDQTPYLEMHRCGGGILNSEINAKGDANETAYMSWYPNQFAKMRSTLTLPLIRSHARGITDTEPIHPRTWTLMDINPEASYGFRFPINRELDALSIKCYVDGEYTEQDYAKMLRMTLDDLGYTLGQNAEGLLIDTLTAVHSRVAALLAEYRLLASGDIVLTLRELLDRSLKQIMVELAGGGLASKSIRSLSQKGLKQALHRAIQDYYCSLWPEEEDHDAVVNSINNILRSKGIEEISIDRHDYQAVYHQVQRIIKGALHDVQSQHPLRKCVPALHLRYAIESDGASMARDLARNNGWKYEPFWVSGFKDEYDIKGSFLPAKKTHSLEEARQIIAFYEKLDPGFVQSVSARVKKEYGKEDQIRIAEALHSVGRGRRWTAQLNWVGAVLARKIKEAEVDPEHIHLLEMEGFQRLDPQAAIMLNEFFLKGKLYLPGRAPLTIPKNLIFFLNSPLEVELDLPPSEKSRSIMLTLYDYPKEKRDALLRQALGLDDKKVRLSRDDEQKIIDRITADWQELNRRIEDSGYGEYKRGISTLLSYAESVAYRAQRQGGRITDYMSALDQGKELFLTATFGYRDPEGDDDPAHIRALLQQDALLVHSLDASDSKEANRFLSGYLCMQEIVDFAVSVTSPRQGVVAALVKDYVDKAVSVGYRKGDLKNLLHDHYDTLRCLEHDDLVESSLVPGDLIADDAKKQYYLFLGTGKRKKSVLLQIEDDGTMIVLGEMPDGVSGQVVLRQHRLSQRVYEIKGKEYAFQEYKATGRKKNRYLSRRHSELDSGSRSSHPRFDDGED